MNKILFLAGAMLLAPLAASMAATLALADAPARSPSGVYSTNNTPLGMLIDNPATKAVLMKYIPAILSSPQIDMARSMTLKQLQPHAPGQLPDATLNAIDADLASVPAAAPTPPGK